jgi:hypothetical protein
LGGRIHVYPANPPTNSTQRANLSDRLRRVPMLRANMSAATNSDPHLLWDQIALYISRLIASFGAPAEIARRLLLNRNERRRFADMIAPIEHAVRRLIYIAALALDPPRLAPRPEHKTQIRRNMPADAGAYFDAANPETWCVRFKLSSVALDRRRSAGMQAPISKNAGEGARGPRPATSATCAERLEALLRAIRDHRALAQKLAQKFARDPRAAINTVTGLRTPKRNPLNIPLHVYVEHARAAFIAFGERHHPQAEDSS